MSKYNYAVEIEDEPEPISYQSLVNIPEEENYRNQLDPERKLKKQLKRMKKFTVAPSEKDRNKSAWKQFRLKYNKNKQ